MNTLIEQIKNNTNKSSIVKKLNDSVASQLPFSSDYHSPLNPCYISQLGSILGSAPHFLIRDGIIPIVEYFLRNQSPPPGFPILIIPVVARGFIPEAWKERIVFYENRSLILKPDLKNLHLYLPTVTDHILNRKEILDRLKVVLAQHSFHSVQLDFIGHSQVVENDKMELQKFLMFQDLVHLVDDHITVGESFEEFEARFDLGHVGVFELAHPLFTYDSYLFHFYSKRSAYVFMDNEFEGGEIIPLSENHAQVLYPHESLADEAGGMIQTIRNTLGTRQITFSSIFQCLSP